MTPEVVLSLLNILTVGWSSMTTSHLRWYPLKQHPISCVLKCIFVRMCWKSLKHDPVDSIVMIIKSIIIISYSARHCSDIMSLVCWKEFRNMHRDNIWENKTTILKSHILRGKKYTEQLFASALMLVVVDWYICVKGTTTEEWRILVMCRSCFCKAHPIHNVNSPH